MPLTTLRERLVKIGGRIVRHGRYAVFQLAEVTVPKKLFAEILRRIERLQGPTVVAGLQERTVGRSKLGENLRRH